MSDLVSNKYQQQVGRVTDLALSIQDAEIRSEFKASQNYIMRPCFKKQTINKLEKYCHSLHQVTRTQPVPREPTWTCSWHTKLYFLPLHNTV